MGYNHWHNNIGAVLNSNSQSSIFRFENGCDWVRISNLRLEGNGKGKIGLDASYGGSIILDNIGLYNFRGFGLKSNQGLLLVSNCFFGNNKVGIQLFSDSTISNAEISGVEIGLYIRAGGNRINNIWVNGATENLVRMEPLNEKVGLQNTSFSNIYRRDKK